MRIIITVALLLLVAAWAPQPRAQSPDARTQNSIVDRNILILQKLLMARPDAEMYYRLADLYVQKGRQTGDITYFNLAKRSLQQALTLEPGFSQGRRHLGYVLYALHDFANAAAEARNAIRLDPGDPYAYGVLGDAELETGQYKKAAQSYGQMVTLRGDLYSYSRRSGIETIRGDNNAAVADLRRAIDDGIRTGEPPEAIAWAQVRLAKDYFLMGDLSDGEAQGEAALKTDPNYHRALAVMGQVRAAQGRFPEAADFYKRAVAIIPMPQYAAALGDVYYKMGRKADAQRQRDLVEFIALNRVLYNRVLVKYYADHDIQHQQAVDMAASELKVRRDIYGHDALAWALYRKGEAAAALPHINTALKFKTTDARLYFHAGMINAALGRKRLARAELNRALRINPHFQPLLDDTAARELAALGGSLPRQFAQGSGARP
jgi:tetratricopeptide (TPR) repeat protein